MFVIFSGVSGVGKNTVINRLLSEDNNRFLIKSATTRACRGKDDNNYDFMSEEEFSKREANGEFFEVINIHTHRSATQFKELQKIIDNPQNVYFKDIDVIGTQKLVEFFKDKDVELLTIFLDAPDDVLHERLINRGESEEKAQLRLSRAKMEREYMVKYDLVIENIDIEKTLAIVRERLEKSHSKK